MAGLDDNPRYTSPIKNVENTESELRIYITPPKQRVHLAPYLHIVKDDIYELIRDDNLLDPHMSYKMYISCFSKYYKYNHSQGITEFGGMYHRSPTDHLPAHSGATNGSFLDHAISNIGNVQLQQQGNMQGSNWIYLGTVQVVIVFIKLLGKPVMVKDFIPYPYSRGRDNIINIDNRKPLNHMSDISPCVVIALRAHFLLTDSDNADRDADLKYLSTNRNGIIKGVYWRKLRKYKISLPAASIITG